VRFRIALTTIVVVTGMTTGIFELSNIPQAAPARIAAHPVAHTQHDASGTTLTNTALAGFAVPLMVHSTSGLAVEFDSGHVVPADTPAPAPAPVPAPAPPPVPVTDANSVATPDWECIRDHESGDEYNDPARPSGAYGILLETWHSFGYSGWPYQAPAAVQDHLALELYSLYGFDPWSTRYVCGL
jgi:Transglycosylase-like domain